MVSPSEWKRIALASGGLLLLVTVPYFLAYTVPAPYVFGGILFNLEDGYSYLAKLRQGWRGEWLFTLPYTAEPGPGIFVYTYHLLLGHVARGLGLSVDVAYHAARLVADFFFLLTAYRLIAHFFQLPRHRWQVWQFFALSSGLGWLAVLFFPPEITPYDLWVSESIPLLTLFNNAHFPFAWLLLLLIVHWTVLDSGRPLWLRMLLTALAVTALAQVQAMTLLPACAVVGAVGGWRVLLNRKLTWAEVAPVGVVAATAGPWVLFIGQAVNSTPVFQAWGAQNITPAPNLWVAFFWGGVPLVLALLGAWHTARQRGPMRDVLVVWLVVCLGLMYMPFPYQRRMSLGVWFPMVVLAAVAVRDVLWPRLSARWRPAVRGLIAVTSTLSQVIVVLAATSSVFTRLPDTYWTQAELTAVRQLPPNALVLAAPITGNLLPTQADVRVLYGHPMETMNGAQQKQRVLDFFTGAVPVESFLLANNIDVIFYGPREAALGPLPALPPDWRIIFQQDDVTVYARP